MSPWNLLVDLLFFLLKQYFFVFQISILINGREKKNPNISYIIHHKIQFKKKKILNPWRKITEKLAQRFSVFFIEANDKVID